MPPSIRGGGTITQPKYRNNTTKIESLVNSTTHIHQKKPRLRDRTDLEPGLVAFYDIRPGNRAGQFLQPQSPHGAGHIGYVHWAND